MSRTRAKQLRGREGPELRQPAHTVQRSPEPRRELELWQDLGRQDLEWRADEWGRPGRCLPSGGVCQRENQVLKASAMGEWQPLEIPRKEWQGTHNRMRISQVSAR